MNFITKSVEIAPNAGFCYGVKRAVETTIKLKKDYPNKKIYILGELIHNSYVINQLEKLGVHTVETLENPAPDNSICIIRSHGASIDLIEKIKKMGYEVVDLTCPDVKKVQDTAKELAQEGYFLIILGRKEHPEVMAIRSNSEKFANSSENILVVKDMDELIQNEKLYNGKKIGVVIQTTQRIEFLKSAVEYLTDKTKDLKVANTICRSTNLRQNEAKEIGKRSDLMIVAGSKKSANTTHLAQILNNITTTLHIENENELDNYRDLIEKSEKIGITAGASTPDRIIKNIEYKIRKGI
ncbi:MAG: 4-hydroxy-3-methylbut-2-enyl diphosphate reductase [Candidatus Gastranaerophilales bacterium]|nr:4-hydroxy-3-methylbut-2-enyl diphosphate reductase [Candidatus Gastranaerophilales bacterium]